MEKSEQVLGVWYRRARESQFAHYQAASRISLYSKLLGVPSVLLSAAVGTAAFVSLQNNLPSEALKIAIGLVSFFAAVLSALQTYLGLHEAAEKHLTTAIAYGAIRREIEQIQATGFSDTERIKDALAQVRHHLDETAKLAPNIRKSDWTRAQEDIKHTDRPHGFLSN